MIKHLYLKRFMYGISTFFIIFSSITSTAFATDGQYNEQFYSNNNIMIYNPANGSCSDGGSNSGGGSVALIGSLSGSNNEQKIYNFWIAAGLTPAQSAGIAGNLQAESGFSPFRQEEGYPWPTEGYGIAQFTGEQRSNVTKQLSTNLGSTYTTYYSGQYGGAVDSSTGFIPSGVPAAVNDQFLLGELNYLLSYASTNDIGGDSYQNTTVPNKTMLLTYMKTLSTPQQAADAWLALYEDPTVPNYSTREGFAEQIFTQYTGSSASNESCPSSSYQCSSSNSSLSSTNQYVTNDAGTAEASASSEAAASVVSTALCLSFPPASVTYNGHFIDNVSGRLACEGKSGNASDASEVDNTGVCVGPPAPAAYATARQTYKTTGESNGTTDAVYSYGGDCGNFIATVMRASGFDPDYPPISVPTLEDYMKAHPSKFQYLGDLNSTNGLQPGDIIVQSDRKHIMLYIGHGEIAQASQGDEMPSQQPFWEGGRIYRPI